MKRELTARAGSNVNRTSEGGSPQDRNALPLADPDGSEPRGHLIFERERDDPCRIADPHTR